MVGVFLTVLHYGCAVVCSAAVGAASGMESRGFSDAKADKTMQDGIFVANLSAVILVACFVLSFFGKGKHSKQTGIALVALGALGGLLSIAHFSLPGIAAGILYVCSGISSIANSKKGAV